MKLNKAKILDDFQDMIRLRTVSFPNMEEADAEAFRAFRELLYRRFPAAAALGEYRRIGLTGLVIRFRGRSSALPSVLMAHYDVVPASEEEWTADPFGGELIDGRIYGRGTLDTKATVCAIMEAAEAAAFRGFVPKNDLYLVFGGEEETCGGTMAEIVSTFAGEGIYPDFVLDEGGAVIPEGLPGVRGQAAMIGIAEKGTAALRIVAEGKSGHASVPGKGTAVDRLTQAWSRIGSHPFPVRLSTAVRLMFRELSGEVKGLRKYLFSHPELMAFPLKFVGGRFGPTVNAMLRTTAAPVILKAGSAGNVIPGRAEMQLSLRLLEGDTADSAAEYLQRVIGLPGVSVEVLSGRDPSPVSECGGEAWEVLKSVVRSRWPEAIISPFQMNGGTDSRYFAEICSHVYRFTPLEMTEKERGTVHGRNESIAEEQLYKTVEFYSELLALL